MDSMQACCSECLNAASWFDILHVPKWWAVCLADRQRRADRVRGTSEGRRRQGPAHASDRVLTSSHKEPMDKPPTPPPNPRRTPSESPVANLCCNALDPNQINNDILGGKNNMNGSVRSPRERMWSNTCCECRGRGDRCPKGKRKKGEILNCSKTISGSK